MNENNNEYGRPIHLPEEPNSFERKSDEWYGEYFDKIYENQKGAIGFEGVRAFSALDVEDMLNKINYLEQESESQKQAYEDQILSMESRIRELEDEIIEERKINSILLSKMPVEQPSQPQQIHSVNIKHTSIN